MPRAILLLLTLATSGLILGNAAIPANAQCEANHIYATTSPLTDWFGAALALHGDMALIGAPNRTVTLSSEGGIFFYRFDGDAWQQRQIFTGSQSTNNGDFGAAVALSSDGMRAVIGAPLAGASSQGQAYVFTYESGTDTWVQQQLLVPSTSNTGDDFGRSVAIDGDVVLVGSPNADPNSVNAGAVYVFRHDGQVWVEEQKLIETPTTDGGNFGQSVALSGSMAVIGAPHSDVAINDAGAVFVFEETGGVWTQTAALVASDAGGSDRFGQAVATDGAVIVVGADLNDGLGSNAGLAYVFAESGGTWLETQTLAGSNTDAGDYFGAPLAVRDGRIVVGAQRVAVPSTYSGAAYVFAFDGLTWTEERSLAALNASMSSYFGSAVGVDGDIVLVGAYTGIGASTQTGAVYAFELAAPPEIDCNGNAIRDACDIHAGLSDDCNANGLPDECETLPSRVYVDADASGSNDGTSWANAYTGLQVAMAFADCTAGVVDQVWVAEGTYAPDVAGGNRHATFTLLSGVELYGGFAGNETALEQRDPNANTTILTGDLNGNDGPNYDNTSDNTYHVVTAPYEAGASAILDGFRVRCGAATGTTSNRDRGAGLYLLGGPTIRNCSVEINIGALGAAAYSVGTTTFEDCVFQWNTATGSGGAMYLPTSPTTVTGCSFNANTASLDGGAICVLVSSISLSDCEFLHNYAHFGNGGAIASSADATVLVDDTLLTENWAGLEGGAIYSNGGSVSLANCDLIANFTAWGAGGALATHGTDPLLFGCAFYGNHATDQGGGFACDDEMPDLVNCIFRGNEALGGGAVYSYNASPLLVNCSLAANSAFESGGGLRCEEDGIPYIANCVLWNNTDDSAEPEHAQIDPGDAAPVVIYSCIQDGWNGAGGNGVIDTDPLFYDPNGPDGVAGTADDDVRLQAASPCIDAGNNYAVPPFIDTDFNGAPRFIDDPLTPDTGSGLAPLVDLGAYESQPGFAVGDTNCDGQADVFDIDSFVLAILDEDGYHQVYPFCDIRAADCDRDGRADVFDIDGFVAAIIHD
ncbi:MAG: right-handed parallel beta-helix repeat-containing protein [Phycisphaerae bacterium]|nr:right-handed parallel beta-helix repeat-containing protein [Phycisphaerae bacterium]